MPCILESVLGENHKSKSFISNAISERTLILKWQTSIMVITMTAWQNKLKTGTWIVKNHILLHFNYLEIYMLKKF